MITIFINNKEDIIKLNINEFISIYSLKTLIANKYKTNIDDIELFYNGKILKNNTSLYSNNILNNTNIFCNTNKLLGGSLVLKILFMILYIISIILYILLLCIGIIPLFSHIYTNIASELIDYILKKLGYNNGNFSIIRMIIKMFTFFMKFFSVYYTVYFLSMIIVFPRLYLKKYDICGSVKVSKKIGKTIAMIFFIIYILFNIPDIIETSLIDLTNFNLSGNQTGGPLIITSWLNPFLATIIEPLDEAKFSFIFAIPFVGTPTIEAYHGIIDVVVELIFSTLDSTQDISCEEGGMDKLLYILKNWQSIPPLKEFIKTQDLVSTINLLIPAFDNKIRDDLLEEIKTYSFWRRYNPFVNKVFKYYSSGVIYTITCFILKILHYSDDELNKAGNVEQVANMIKVGNISGVCSSIALIIIFILTIFMNKMYGVKYG